MQLATRYTIVVIAGLLLLGGLASFRHNPSLPSQPSKDIQEAFLEDLQQFEREIVQLQKTLDAVYEEEDHYVFAQKKYLSLRDQYKKIEPLLAYLQPETTVKAINGAPLPKIDPMEEVRPVVVQPEGLQVIDELFFEDDFIQEYSAITKLLEKLRQEVIQLERFLSNTLHLTDRMIFEACRLELVRIFTLGVTGFDTPGSVNALSDAQVALSSISQILMQYQPLLVERDHTDLALSLQEQLDLSQSFLNDGPGFEDFDRMAFLRNHINPLFKLILDVHLALEVETFYDISPAKPAVNYLATNLFSEDFLHTNAYVKLDAKDDQHTKAKVNLGRYLFFDPVLSSLGNRTCASCHDPAQGFTDGERKSIATDLNGTVSRNAPTILNAVYSDRFFHDLRSSELEMQVDHVVFSEKEFNTNYVELIQRLNSSPEYLDLFYQAYPRYQGIERPAINPNTIKGALAAYVKSISSFNSEFDRYARGELEEVDPSTIRGFNIFMGKGACGTCHFAPSFHGLVPPYYKESESEVLGIPSEPVWKEAELDPDKGRAVNGVPLDAAGIFLYSFKTPTVRNVALTAPYMHNGVYDSLAQVMRFYNLGGGKGIGIHLENQTLPFDNLNLSQEEMNDVIRFMESLTDTTGLTDIPHRLPTFPEGSPYEERKIGGEY